jgi:hypothetical protein
MHYIGAKVLEAAGSFKMLIPIYQSAWCHPRRWEFSLALL